MNTTPRFLTIPLVLFLALAAGAWAQPPVPPQENNDAHNRPFQVNRNRTRIQRENGQVFLETLGPNGEVLNRRKLGGPPQPPFAMTWTGAPAAGGGGVAATDNFVYVLLDGTLYQYDAATLKLKNKVVVKPPGPQVNVLTQTLGANPQRPRLGITIAPVTQDLADQQGLEKPTGVLVTGVMPGTPAEKAKLQVGDLVLKFNGKEVDSPEGIQRLTRQAPNGKPIEVEILRDGKRETVTVNLNAEQPVGAANTTTTTTVTATGGETGATTMRVETRTTEADGGQRKLTLDFQNADLREVLRILGQQAGVKITLDNAVNGKLDATLHDMTVEQALDTLLEPRGLVWEKKEDGTIHVRRGR